MINLLIMVVYSVCYVTALPLMQNKVEYFKQQVTYNI